MRNLIFVCVLIIVCSCSSTKKVAMTENKEAQPITERILINGQTFLLSEISTDKTYGFSEKNPIQVGGVDKQEGPLNERRFLNALAGPNGEKVSYHRAGSCCFIKSKNAIIGDMVPLDDYRVTWEGSKDTVSIYINMYDYGVLKAPIGFTIKEQPK